MIIFNNGNEITVLVFKVHCWEVSIIIFTKTNLEKETLIILLPFIKIGAKDLDSGENLTFDLWISIANVYCIACTYVYWKLFNIYGFQILTTVVHKF